MMKAEEVLKDWGSFKVFSKNETTTVKILEIKQDARISLQRHNKRSEQWICLEGEFEVVCGVDTVTLKKGDNIVIGQGIVHRAKGMDRYNRLLEISYGEFDEEDIERIEDDYGRIIKKKSSFFGSNKKNK